MEWREAWVDAQRGMRKSALEGDPRLTYLASTPLRPLRQGSGQRRQLWGRTARLPLTCVGPKGPFGHVALAIRGEAAHINTHISNDTLDAKQHPQA